MQSIRKKIVTDEGLHPVAVVILYLLGSSLLEPLPEGRYSASMITGLD
nr:hypothetical protein [Desulfobulbaceae bacterium]